MDGAGGFRPGWRGLLSAVTALGHDRLLARAAVLDRALAEAIEAEPGPPRFDPIPLILAPGEFAALTAGLAQRAALIAAVLADVYGPQRLLAQGALPPALVFANPAFLRPCRDPLGGPRTSPFLQLYAADLLRGPDGAWRVVADRTAVPAGLANAALHRAEGLRAVPELFRAADPLPHRPFFDLWGDALLRLARGIAAAEGRAEGREGSPGVAVLGSGPGSARRAETLLLARELSCPLVEGGDLTVRDGAVFLKTLGGLRRIEVLVRRQDGRGVDPLELDPDPRSGAAGLLEAARGGAVAVVNDPGAGFAEAPALAAFLPRLAPRLLDEGLRLPAAETLWLGEPHAAARFAADPDRWVVRRAGDGTVASQRPATLAPAGRAALLARIAANPAGYVAAAALPASTAPCLRRDPHGAPSLLPRGVVLRLFLLWDGAAWRAFGGGLARSLAGADGPGLPKDVWVSAEERAELRGPASLALAPLALRRAARDLPSRAADDFYWLGRHLERLEGMARLLGAAAARLAGGVPSPREVAELALLAGALQRAGLLAEEGAGTAGGSAFGRGLLRATAPLTAELNEIARLAAGLSDRLSGEMRGALGTGLRPLAEAVRAGADGPGSLSALTARLTAFVAMLAGLISENMVRGGGRLFLDLGRRVERAAGIAGLLGALLRPIGRDGAGAPHGPADPGRLEGGLRLALEIGDAVLTYRARYLTLLQPAPVLDLVLADPANPRSLAFQLDALRDGLLQLEGGSPDAVAARALREETEAMVAAVARGDGGQAAAAAALAPQLDRVAAAIAALSDRVARRWFALLPAPRGIGLPGMPAREGARRRGAA